MDSNNCYEEPQTILQLDQSIGSTILTKFYRTSAARVNSTLINFVQCHQLFQGALRVNKPPLLLMRASRDGFDKETFHNLCDDQGKIVIIVKSEKGDLFGGFTSENVKFDARGTNVRDDKAFTFRFEDYRLYIFKLFPAYAVSPLVTYSLTYLFAFRYCFWLCHNANTSAWSSSYKGTEDYILTECRLPKKTIGGEITNTTSDSEEKRQYFGGFDFLVEDFEVYKIMD